MQMATEVRVLSDVPQLQKNWATVNLQINIFILQNEQVDPKLEKYLIRTRLHLSAAAEWPKSMILK